jgi:folate-binding protein YgfZ
MSASPTVASIARMKLQLIPLTAFGVLAFTGADARAFLQGQLSCDVAGLAPDAVTPGSYNTPKGRMLASFLLWAQGDGFRMQLPRELCEPVRKRLAMFILRSKVTAEEVSAQYRLYGLIGGEVAEALSAAGIAPPPRPWSRTIANGAVAVRYGTTRCALIVDAVFDPALLKQLPATAGDERAWRLADIRDGLPWIFMSTQEQFVPQTANLDLIGGVSFNKGCYPGQEIVARMHFLGRLKERMVRARSLGAAPDPGTRLYSATFGEQAAGTIVDAVALPEGGCELLAVAQLAAVEAGDLAIGQPGGPRLTVLPLPYAVPAK